MTVRRFFAPGAGAAGDTVDLPSEEADHLARVLRLRAGDAARVFDGRGHEWIACVDVVEKRRATLRLVSSVVPSAEPRVAITLAPAMLKGDGLDEVVRDATVLGVVAVRPLLAARSEGGAASHAAARIERWRRVAIAAAKQCGRAVVPTIEVPRSFDLWVRSQPARPNHAVIMTVEPTPVARDFSPADAPRQSLQEYQDRHPTPPSAATILIGPEGGWTKDELLRAAEAGCELVTLGRRTFRADATPLVALALFQFVWGDL